MHTALWDGRWEEPEARRSKRATGGAAREITYSPGADLSLA